MHRFAPWFLFVAAALPAQQRAHAAARAIAEALVDGFVPAEDAMQRQVLALLAAAHAHRQHACAFLPIDAAKFPHERLEDPQAVLAALAPLREPDAHGHVALAATHAAIKLLTVLGRHDEVAQLSHAAGWANEWLAIGPFGDGGNYYSGRPFTPELEFPPLGRELPGRFAKVAPRVVTRRPEAFEVELAGPARERTGCFYGLHRVVATEATLGWLEIMCRSSFEAFVNGERAYAREWHLTRDTSLVQIPVVLRPGHNHVLLKTTLNDRSAIGLRYIDAEGRPLAGLREVPAAQALEPWAPAVPDLPRPGRFATGLAALQAALGAADAADQPVLQTALALGAHLLANDPLAFAAADALLAAPPAELRLRLALAAILPELALLPQELRRGRVRQLVERDLDTSPTLAALEVRIALLEDEDKREEAIRLLERKLGAGQAGERMHDRLFGLYRGLRFEAEARVHLARWARALPTDIRPLQEEAQQRQAGGDLQGAQELAGKALALRPGDPALLRLCLRLAESVQQPAAALALRRRLDAHVVDPLAVQLEHARLLERLEQRDAAAKAWQQLAKSTGVSADALLTCGEALLRHGQPEAAVPALRACLARDPAKLPARRLLERLEGRPVDAEFAAFRRPAESVLEGFRPSEREATASTSLLLDQMLVRVYEDGSQLEEVHQVKRINDVRGGESSQVAERPSSAHEVLRLRTLGVDGKSYVPNRVEDAFNMPRLEPGAFTEEEYQNLRPSPLPGPWRGTTFYFRSEDEPYLLSELIVILPAGTPMEFRLRNFEGERDKRPLDGGLEAHVFRARNVPRLPQEKLAPPQEEALPVVALGQDAAPEPALREAGLALAGRLLQTSAIERQARELCANLGSDLEKAQAIHRFVHDTVPESRGSGDPTAILLTRKGPRFYLEVALLRAAGIPGTLALCCAEREALREPPGFFLGDDPHRLHAYRIEPAGAEPLWLFADLPRHVPLGVVPAQRLGASALLLRPEGRTRVPLPGGDPLREQGLAIGGHVTLAKDGQCRLEVEVTVRGVDGLGAKEQIRNLEENVQQVVARQLAGEIFAGWRLQTIALVGLDQAGKPLQAKGTFTKTGALKQAGESWLLPLPLARGKHVGNLGDRGQRTLPYVLRQDNAQVWEITLDLGEGYRLVELPEDTNITHPLLEYEQTFRFEGNRVHIRREFRQHTGRLAPGLFAEWMALLRRLDLIEEANLRLARR